MREFIAASGGASQAQKELANLVRAGLVTRVPRGNQVWFQANPAAPVFAELQGLIAKSFGIAEIVRNALQPLADRLQAAFIYGSVARGEPNAASDVDVLIIGDVLLSDLAPHLDAAEAKLGRTISPTLIGAVEFQQRVKAKEHFVSAIMEGPKVWLVGDAETVKAGRI